MALSNGNKVSVTVISSAVVAGIAVGTGAATGHVADLAVPALTAFFGFLGGLLMGHVLG